MFILREAKQVGVLYHFTSIKNLESIINDNALTSNLHDYISFTRSYDITKSSSMDYRNFNVRLSFDGDKLSNKFKISPYVDTEFGISRQDNEAEERVEWPRYKPLPCMFALKRIDIIDNKETRDYIDLIKSIKLTIVLTNKFVKVA